MDKKIKIGIAGAGNIVPDFLEAIKNIKDYELDGICATKNGIEKMEKLSKQYGIKNIYTNYDELLNSEIEVIYIAVPNHLHYEFTKKAIEKNKHIILEKPFTSNFNEAVELVELAQENKIMLFEAITNQYFPNYEKTKQLLSELGNIKIVQLNYSQYSSRYDNFKKGIIAPTFDPKKSGGALMDLNVYNIYFTIGLFGAPEKVFYTANIEKDIDTSGILILEYPTFKAVMVGAKDCEAPRLINIQGDKGVISSSTSVNIYSKFSLKLNNGEFQEFELNEENPRLYYELVEFLNIYKNEDFEKIEEYNEKSLIVMKILDIAKEQVGLKF